MTTDDDALTQADLRVLLCVAQGEPIEDEAVLRDMIAAGYVVRKDGGLSITKDGDLALFLSIIPKDPPLAGRSVVDDSWLLAAIGKPEDEVAQAAAKLGHLVHLSVMDELPSREGSPLGHHRLVEPDLGSRDRPCPTCGGHVFGWRRVRLYTRNGLVVRAGFG